MNVKTLILGVVMGGMIAAGTYFFVPTPNGAYAQSTCATSDELLGGFKALFVGMTKLQVDVGLEQRNYLDRHIENLDRRNGERYEHLVKRTNDLMRVVDKIPRSR